MWTTFFLKACLSCCLLISRQFASSSLSTSSLHILGLSVLSISVMLILGLSALSISSVFIPRPSAPLFSFDYQLVPKLFALLSPSMFGICMPGSFTLSTFDVHVLGLFIQFASGVCVPRFFAPVISDLPVPRLLQFRSSLPFPMSCLHRLQYLIQENKDQVSKTE